MKVSCDQRRASDVGPKLCGGDRNVVVEALTEGHALEGLKSRS